MEIVRTILYNCKKLDNTEQNPKCLHTKVRASPYKGKKNSKLVYFLLLFTFSMCYRRYRLFPYLRKYLNPNPTILPNQKKII